MYKKNVNILSNNAVKAKDNLSKLYLSSSSSTLKGIIINNLAVVNYIITKQPQHKLLFTALSNLQPNAKQSSQLIKSESKIDLENLYSEVIAQQMSECEYTGIVMQNVCEQIENDLMLQQIKSLWLTSTLNYIDLYKYDTLLPKQLNLIAKLYILNKQPLIADGLLNEAYDKSKGDIYIQNEVIKTQCEILKKLPKQHATYLSMRLYRKIE